MPAAVLPPRKRGVKTQPSPCLKLLAWSDSSPIERCRPSSRLPRVSRDGRDVQRLGIGAFAVGFAVAALTVAGCGGGDDNSTTGTSGAAGASGAALSEQEFVSQANAACKEANDKIAALKAPTDLPSTADFASQAESIDNDVYAKLAALTPPSDLQSVWSQYLGGAKALISTIAPLQAAAEAGDSKKAQALADEVKAAGDKLDAVASRMGLTECAKDVQPQG